jgi:hypothetical protein
MSASQCLRTWSSISSCDMPRRARRWWKSTSSSGCATALDACGPGTRKHYIDASAHCIRLLLTAAPSSGTVVGHNAFVGNFGDHITVGLLECCCEACGQAMTATRKVHLVLGVRGGERLLVADGAGKGGAPPLQPNAHQVLIALARQRLRDSTTGWSGYMAPLTSM